MGSRYFDNAATTRVKEEVLNKMLPFFNNQYGNPSSMYTLGRNAKRALEEARKNVANLINANPNEIVFLGGGSEADNMALKGIAHRFKEKGNHIITSKIEHPAIINTCKTLEKEGFQITYLNVDSNGIVDIEELKSSITNKTILISIMFANNEIGTIQPIEQISKIAKENGIIFHTDAVQACGNIPIDVKRLGIDLLSLSGHKLYGPKGTGALYIKNGIEIESLIDGGHQEKGKRAGTENVAGFVGLGEACKISKENINTHYKYLKKLRDYYISQVEQNIIDVNLNGSREERLPGNANFSFKNVNGEALLLKLDELGIAASSGSACSTGNPNPSHVLTAIGLNEEEAKSALRVTFGEDNEIDDVDYMVRSIERIVDELRKNNIEK